MKKLIMLIAIVGVFALSGCTEDVVEPIDGQEIPATYDPTNGDDDDEDCGQVGGGCGG